MRKRYWTVLTVCGLYFLASYAVLTAAVESQRGLLHPRAPGTAAIADRMLDLDECALFLLGAGLIALVAVYVFIWAPMERAVRVQTAALERAATTDPLTGLLNRHAFGERTAAALAGSARHHRRGAMLMIDIDRFKAVNDTYGHATGDRVIREIGARLALTVRADEIAARLGGDEFAVFAPDVDEGLETFVARIHTAVCFTMDLDGAPLTISTSVGIARFPVDGFTIEALLGAADRALYDVKRTGRGDAGYVGRPAVVA